MVGKAASTMGSDASNRNDPEAKASPSVGPTLVDRWTALDRGWQALCLGLAIVAVHLGLQAF